MSRDVKETIASAEHYAFYTTFAISYGITEPRIRSRYIFMILTNKEIYDQAVYRAALRFASLSINHVYFDAKFLHPRSDTRGTLDRGFSV